MSGDVQPRKRRDKRKKKDDVGVEEPKGTAAALGDGDVFMHSYSDHGTGGHWCAKIIFFSLLAVLVALIGLIILENRGLTDLDASTVQSQYSGVLDGWLEDAPGDDHHDEHTLELNHPDDGDEDHDVEHNLDDDVEDDDLEHDSTLQDESAEKDADDDEANPDDDDEDEYRNNEQDEDDENESNENDDEEDNDPDNDEEDEDDVTNYDDDNDNNDDEEGQNNEDDDENIDEYKERNNEEEEDDHEEEDDEDEEVELEHIEHEPSDVEPISIELPALPEEDDDDDDDDKASDEPDDDDDDDNDDNDDDDGDEYLEQDDDNDDYVPEVVELVSAPSGKPYKEVEDSNEVLPADTLAEEEEYEQRQEELRREEAETTHMWLKLVVGAALLAATQAVVRRASRGSNDAENGEMEVEDDDAEAEIVERRMTLVPNEESAPAPEAPKKETVLETLRKTPILIQTTKPTIEDDEEEDQEEPEEEIIKPINIKKIESKPQVKHFKEVTPEKELYSDEEELEESDTEEPVVVLQNNKENGKKTNGIDEVDDVPDDVEIIDEELLDEELIEEEMDDEEEISDVDDSELLNRLEAKYGRLPNEEKKDGGDSVEEDFWAEEPNDPYWRQQLNEAENHLHQGSLSAAVELVSAPSLKSSARARWLMAQALERLAEQRRDNALLSRCIAAYLELLKMNERLTDKQLLAATNRTVDRMNFRGNYLGTEPVYRLLIRRFPNEPMYYNNLTIAFLMANRADLAVKVLKETLKLWPDDRVALAHYAFVQKTLYNKLEESVELFQRALEGDKGPAVEPRFYFHLGDALLLLGRFEEAHEVHKRGAALGMFLSPQQRSLYNVNHLKSTPWWNIDDTPYRRLAHALEKAWKEILKEGEAARELYEQEKEGLRERGEWSQLDLFIRGREVPGRCKRAPVTCSVVRSEMAAVGCRRGQIKFSSMAPGTHVRPHVGPTNCRLRMHLGLSNTNNTFLRVDKETRQWHVGKVLMFDDSFEHEVWHNGTAPRLVLIVDVWHPSLTAHERRTLPAI